MLSTLGEEHVSAGADGRHLGFCTKTFPIGCYLVVLLKTGNILGEIQDGSLSTFDLNLVRSTFILVRQSY